jgi:multidrug efflux system membrane fusion protein
VNGQRFSQFTAPSPSRGHTFARAAALIVVLALVSGCTGKESAPNSMAAQGPVAVLVAPVEQKTVPNQLREVGTVEAYSTVSIKSRVEGHLETIHFKEGDLVKKGQLLFTIDRRTYQAALDQANANLARDVAQAKQAETDEQRYAYLLKFGVGSREQYDQAHAQAASLIAAAAADRAAVESMRLNLAYTEIRSPIDGRTGHLSNHEGDLIKADADSAMVVINQIEPIYVDFHIPESDLAQVRQDMQKRPLEVDAGIPGQPQAPEHGMLSFIENTVDNTTGQILLKGLFQNENRRLWPGLYVNAVLTLHEIPNAIVVPSQAIQNGQQGSFVFVVGHDMKVQSRPVVAGTSLDGQTIVERGLAQGETVVTDGQLRLAPGMTVKVKESLNGGAGSPS